MLADQSRRRVDGFTQVKETLVDWGRVGAHGFTWVKETLADWSRMGADGSIHVSWASIASGMLIRWRLARFSPSNLRSNKQRKTRADGFT